MTQVTVFRAAMVLMCLCVFFPPASRAEGLEGEVATDKAYLVEKDARHVPANLPAHGQYYEFTVRIKVKEAGTYYVVGGFLKEKKWLKGVFTGNKFWSYEKVTLGAGDEKVLIIQSDFPPVGARIWDVGIYSSLTDMKHYR